MVNIHKRQITVREPLQQVHPQGGTGLTVPGDEVHWQSGVQDEAEYGRQRGCLRCMRDTILDRTCITQELLFVSLLIVLERGNSIEAF